MDGVAGFGVGAIEKHVDAGAVTVVEAYGFESGGYGGQVATVDQEVDIGSVADGGLIDTGDPGGDGIATDYGIGDIGLFQSTGSTQKTFADFFHGTDHPFPGNRL